jgi:hypothetical protein
MAAENWTDCSVAPGISMVQYANGWLAGGYNMQQATFKKFQRGGAYLVGGLLLFLGVTGFFIQFKRGMLSSTNFQGYVLAIALTVSGGLTCGAVRVQYGGGLWSFVGVICSAIVIFRFANAIQIEMRGEFLVHPVDFFSKTAGLFGVGCYCLIWGHIRRHRKRKECLHDAT